MRRDARVERPAIGLKAKVAAAAGALVVGALLCEGVARLAFPAPPNPAREPAVLYQSLPGVGFIPAVNQTAWIDDGLVTTNALGLRGALPARPKPPGVFRVLAIGDSTTFGWGVNDPETYPVLLEARLNAELGDGRRWEVVNGGVSGYDMKRATRLLAYLAPRLEPDLVLVGLFWNDLPYERVSPDGIPQSDAPAGLPAPDAQDDLQTEPAPAAGATSGTAAGSSDTTSPGDPALETLPDPPPSAPFRIRGRPTTLNRVLRSSRLLYVLRQSWAGLVAPTGAGNNQLQWERALLEGRRTAAIDAAWQDVEASLTEMRDLGAAGGYEVGVMPIPIRAQVEQTFPEADYQTRVRDMAARLGMFVVDPLPYLTAQTDVSGLFIPYDRMHFSPAGNAQLAAAVFDALRERPSRAGRLAH
jgi:lysophospholipase L1-like esterase